MKTPEYYNNEKGSLYKFGEEHNLDPWSQDLCKRVFRCRKKGLFKQDIEKSIFLCDIYLKEYKDNWFKTLKRMFSKHMNNKKYVEFQNYCIDNYLNIREIDIIHSIISLKHTIDIERGIEKIKVRLKNYLHEFKED